jgi:hypothetical protein
VFDDPAMPGSKLFIKAKNNLAADTKALRYSFAVKTVGRDAKLGVDITAPFVVWDAEHVDVTANEALAAASGMVAGAAKQEACEFLLDRLAAGPVKVDDLTEEAKHNGIAIKDAAASKEGAGHQVAQGERPARRRMDVGAAADREHGGRWPV